ncbi:MAG: hypothetical protein Q9164_000171 [Protoblastenia rupestris]
MSLIGPIDDPVDNEQYHREFEMAKYLATNTFTDQKTGKEKPFINSQTLRQILEAPPGPRVNSALLDSINFLLVINHGKRPPAVEAAEHAYLKDLDYW